MSNSEQMLFRGNQKVPLSTKIYYLLLTLVENTGQVLSKDEIIETVWPGQIVTDTALAQQILRLRQVLEDNNRTQPLIETHRGIGYRFTAAVEILRDSNSTTSTKLIPYSRWLVYAIIVLSLLGYWISSRDVEMAGSQTKNYLEMDSAISLAIVPLNNKRDWLNLGGLDYLSELLSQHDKIRAISPEPEWYSSESPEKLAIELTTNKNINYTSLIDISETESGFELKAKLRTSSGVLSVTNLSAATLPQLFEKTDKWITANLSVQDQLQDIETSVVYKTADTYALQSYLQGVFEIEMSGNEQKASDYFQAAVNKDPAFLNAWIRLAKTHIELGNFKKAIAIATAHIGTSGVEGISKASMDLHFITAMAYVKLRDNKRAQESIQVSIDQLKGISDPYTRLAALQSLTLLATLQGDLQTAESLVLEQLSISKEFYPLPNYLGEVHLTLATIYQKANKFDRMKTNLDSAIILFEETNNSNGMIKCFYLMVDRYTTANMFDEVYQLTIQAEPYLDKSTLIDDKAFFLYVSAYGLNLRGHFDRAQNYIQRLRVIAEQTNNDQYLFMAEFVKGQALYVQNRFSQAKNNIISMKATFNDGGFSPSNEDFFYSKELLVSARVDPPENALAMWRQYNKLYPNLIQQFPATVTRAEGHIHIRLGQVTDGIGILLSAEQIARDKEDIQVANYIGYEVLEILLEHPEMEYKDTIDRLSTTTEYDYLFFKLKAQFQAREGNYLEATMLMQENKLRANQLWKPEDQLLLENFQQKSI